MAKSKRAKKTTGAQRAARTADARQKITNKFIEAITDAIKNGTALPWRKPWTSEGCALHPFNGVSKRRYRGINVFLLAMEGYSSPEWFTYNQVAGMKRTGKDEDGKPTGPHVRKGEKSTTIVLWKLFKKTKTNDAGDEETDQFWTMKTYRVFNREQCDGFPEEVKEATGAEAPKVVLNNELALALRDASECPISHRGGRAFYRPSTDRITLPKVEKFDDERAYYATLFHEMAHSTGHKSRLDRDLTGSGSKEKYAAEELVAELSAAFLCAEVGVEQAGQPDENHTAYLRSWLKALKDDTKLILRAAGKAQRASDRILGTVAVQEQQAAAK